MNNPAKKYDPIKVEAKWQKIWAKSNLYKAIDDDKSREKYYILVEFPYPSGDGLHVGHVRSFTAQDVVARRLRMMGKNVMYPMGWDAFGLPTENFAIKHKIKPQDATMQNIATFKRQMQSLGLSFDWDREINTTDPKYYRWTQWIFLQLLRSGLAYQKEIAINWCPSCKTGLANEEVVNGCHERCDTPVEKKLMQQWMLKITEYADRLIKGLDDVDYLQQITTQQVNWVGRSEGASIQFPINGHRQRLTIYTTRPDTIFGATFIVLAPEHPLVTTITSKDKEAEVSKYIKKAHSRSNIDRMEDQEKTGVFTGAYAVNPATQENIPIWVADYVLMDYGTGAIMSVPAHDERDYEFATQFGLEIRQVVDGRDTHNGPHTISGNLINSDRFDGLDSDTAKLKIIDWLVQQKVGQKQTQYKLRDWIFSRQHYWGEPIPVIHCKKCGVVPVPEDQLPVELPDVENYEPTDTGESPLANIPDWVNVDCPRCSSPARRETDTMPNWAGSSWYYLRYIDPHNDQIFADPDKLKHWLMVDLYNGGMEHTTLHLLYSRFWHQFLFDQGLVPTPEPYAKRRSHGMVLGTDGNKMSKSKGNVINPDDVVSKHGADSLRMYEMFMGPYDQAIDWSDEKLAGVYRFINRVFDLIIAIHNEDKPTIGSTAGDETFETAVDSMAHKTLKRVNQQIEKREFNTMVSAIMEFVNFLNEPTNRNRLESENFNDLALRTAKMLVLILAPVTPHFSEELWQALGGKESVHLQPWPKYNPELVKDNVVTIVIQINGKLKGEFVVNTEDAHHKDKLEHMAKEVIGDKLEGQEIVKTVVVPSKLVNFVVKA